MAPRHAVDAVDEIVEAIARVTFEDTEGQERAVGFGLAPTRAAAAVLGLAPRALEDWRLRGVGPRFIRLSPRAVRYRVRELARFIAEREVSSTSDPGPDKNGGAA